MHIYAYTMQYMSFEYMLFSNDIYVSYMTMPLLNELLLQMN